MHACLTLRTTRTSPLLDVDARDERVSAPTMSREVGAYPVGVALLARVVSLPVVGAIVVGAVVVSLGAMFLTLTIISTETASAPLAMAPIP